MERENNISAKKIKQFIFVLFFLILFAPMIQQKFKLIKEKELADVENQSPYPEFTTSKWLDGSYQKEFEKALDVNVGFRRSLVRFQNQLNYSIYNISKSWFVVVGKNNYLYGKPYITGYTGDDFVGAEYINLQIEKAKIVEQELNKKNITLIFAFAPGKGSYYPEYIPDHFLKAKNPDSTNYKVYLEACNKTNLNVVDLRSCFLSIKDSIQHPLYSRVGVHWSAYGAALAMKKINEKIEEIRNTKLTHFQFSDFSYSDTISSADRDVEKMMNVFSNMPHFKMANFKLHYSKDSVATHPKLLAISDSYFSTITETGIVDSVYSDWDYWIYNNPLREQKQNTVFDLKREIEKKDIILLLATDATLAGFPYSFLDNTFELYAPKDKFYFAIKEKEFRLYVTGVLTNIEKNKKWKKQLIKSAKENKRTAMDEYISSAIWLYQEWEKKNKTFMLKK